MRGIELHYVSSEIADQISNIIKEFIDNSGKPTGKELLDSLSKILPIERMDTDTVRRRVEGLHFVTEILWQKILDTGKFNRQEIIQMAKLKPLSYYHYLTGSRDPVNNVLSRDDYLNDPSSAIAKLTDDITGLAQIIPLMIKG
ncbi:MAG: hypothetical protein P9M15_01315 [Candidatus Electryoneaceae bacterium]|nr:hypothetical protein [Candidatus Electryoneaceae bacterium]